MVLRLARLSASAAAAADSAQQKMQRQTCARDELLKGGRECATSTCHDLRWQPRVDCKARFEFAALRLREVLGSGGRRAPHARHASRRSPAAPALPCPSGQGASVRQQVRAADSGAGRPRAADSGAGESAE